MDDIDIFYREVNFFIEYIEGDDKEFAGKVKAKLEEYKNDM